MESNALMHYGVLGMKWGVRKDRSSGSAKKRGKSSWSDDAREARAIKKKKVKQMSNAELKKLNERTRLEQEYSRLNPNVISKGWKMVVATAGAMGTIMAIKNNGSQIVDIGKKFLKK